MPKRYLLRHRQGLRVWEGPDLHDQRVPLEVVPAALLTSEQQRREEVEAEREKLELEAGGWEGSFRAMVEVEKELHARLAECYRLTGEDPDAADDRMLAGFAVDAVKEFRRRYDEDTNEELELRESAETRLREALSLLNEADSVIEDALDRPLSPCSHEYEAGERVRERIAALATDPHLPDPTAEQAAGENWQREQSELQSQSGATEEGSG